MFKKLKEALKKPSKKLKILILILIIIFSSIYYFIYTNPLNSNINEKPNINIQENIIMSDKSVVSAGGAIFEIAGYLKNGTNYYNEEENSIKALKILEDMEESFYTNYYKGYANEIVSKYGNSILYYNRALKTININIKLKALALNQLGHVYDLKGDLESANKYYLKSEELGQNLVGNIINRGRYEYRTKNYDIAENYFNLALEQNIDSFVNSEIYFNLSVIFQNKTDSLDKAIEYSNLGIEANKDYPNNYLSLGVSYIMKGGDYIDNSVQQFQKAISLYPNSSMAYKYLGIYYYIKDDFDNSIKNFELQLEKSQIDIILMANEKETIKKDALYDLSKVYALKGDEIKSMEYLNKVLDGNNTNYYISFLKDFSTENGPFSSIINTEIFEENFVNIARAYKK